jgi:hypothetical protein
MCFIFPGKFYASIGAPEFILTMPCIPIAIFLSYENPPFDSCIFEKHWAIQNRILHSKFEFRNFPTPSLRG